MVKITCLKYNEKEYIRVGPENTNAPGIAPLLWRPGCDSAVFLNRDFR